MWGLLNFIQAKDSTRKSTSRGWNKTSANRTSRDFVRLDHQRNHHHDPSYFFSYELDSATSSSAVNSAVITESLEQLSRGVEERRQVERQLSLSRGFKMSDDNERTTTTSRPRIMSHTSV
jgi:hypothetical protein